MIQLPHEYETLDALVRKYSSPPAKILEVGCSDAEYLRFLSTQGYQTTGLDAREYEGVVKGRIENIEEVLPGEMYDVILARGVFSESAVLMYFLAPAQQGTMFFLHNLAHQRGEASPKTEFLNAKSRKMLAALYPHLNPGGCLIAVEDYVAGEELSFGREIAKKAGYQAVEIKSGK
jgi:hypothetical protein